VKGVFFKEQLEFRLEVRGDEWYQGDTLSCVLSVRNRGAAKQPLSGLYLHLAQASVKSVRDKAYNAFQVVGSARLDAAADIEPGAEQNFPWTFELDKNCVISEKSQSLYLICGREALSNAAGQLAVTVLPHPHIEAVLSLLESSFAFVLKGQKSKKNWVEAKLKPPSGKEYPTLEHLMLSFRFDAETLLLKYCFHLKTIQASATTLTVGKATREIEQQFHSSNYLFPGGLINNQPLETAIAETLAVVKSKM
jgi:sporulation-control protein spo0M